ncbi:hypothetical protein [Dialister sp.]|uniref:hypothetical protein n=1 Tax=Dialister sp. TaxID=1955814 RepID=UPI002E7FD6AC|nr:hypothetical protein [Dialister sp.]MEE3453018.1 hypothetical protein [Dialister sp.]
MKKKLFLTLLFAAASFTAFAYNPYAPNSFDSVNPKSWDYQTALSLCREGKAPDYDERFFNRGEITRYELAGVVKNLLENNSQKGDDGQKLAKLKKEYARELESLGYHEEKKKPGGTPIFEIGGDGRIRYNNDGKADARVRIETRANIG